ncbi:hypothetical protein EUGRSUZ_C00798 [Eucalyptus grandis]|uniref:Uncharacterized protein n=2 Tax=Eucalyptus grandis TaxID=71139 RepID=A0ACC3LBI0_EUCGR|nr:hypothetical protein EUGRSUZ_C00798 [Eucalyptus grandis]
MRALSCPVCALWEMILAATWEKKKRKIYKRSREDLIVIIIQTVSSRTLEWRHLDGHGCNCNIPLITGGQEEDALQSKKLGRSELDFDYRSRLACTSKGGFDDQVSCELIYNV